MTAPPSSQSPAIAMPREKDAHLWARHPQDWYVEPLWISERLFDVEKFVGVVSDPACGLGRILQSANYAGYLIYGSDIVYRSDYCDRQRDYLNNSDDFLADNIVSNPPFGIADKFARRAIDRTYGKVALLLPTKWMNGAKRGAWLETTPLCRVWLLGPRPSMPPGPVIEAGIAPGNGTTDFAWFVWERGYEGRPELRWLRRG